MSLQKITKTLDILGGVCPCVGDKYEPLLENEINEIEKHFNYKIPKTLRVLLKNFGSFRFNNYVLYNPTLKFPELYSRSNTGIVCSFLGKLNKNFPKAKSMSLMHLVNLHKIDFSTRFLPFAENGAGDILGIQVSDGSILNWWHDAPKNQEFLFVSNSFDSWFNSFYAEER